MNNKKSCKKITFTILCLAISLAMTNSVIFAKSNNLHEAKYVNDLNVSIKIKDKHIDFTIMPEMKGKISYKALEDLANENPEGNNFIIHEAVAYNPKSDAIEIDANAIYNLSDQENNNYSTKGLLPDYHIYTNLTYTSRDVLDSNQFITSVAKGASYSFSSTKEFSVSASVTGDASVENLGITASLTKSYSKSYVFNGPAEDSTYNCRVYKIKFYEDRGNYTRYCLDESTTPYPTQIWKQTGTFQEPTYYYAYSYDINV